MSRWPELPQTTEPGYAYGVLLIRKGWGRRTSTSVLAMANVQTCEVTPVEYLSRDCYDFSSDEFAFRPYGSRESYPVIEGNGFDFEMDEADVQNAHQRWSAYQTKRLTKHVQKAARTATTARKPKL